MGKHSGKDEGIDPNSPQGVEIRQEIQIDTSQDRLDRDVAIVDNGWNNTPKDRR